MLNSVFGGAAVAIILCVMCFVSCKMAWHGILYANAMRIHHNRTGSARHDFYRIPTNDDDDDDDGDDDEWRMGHSTRTAPIRQQLNGQIATTTGAEHQN